MRLISLAALSGLLAGTAAAQAPAPRTELSPYANLRVRYESWSWFDPGAAAPAGSDNNSYGYAAGVFKGGVRLDTHRWLDATVEFQNTALLGLPDDAKGPAPIGEMGGGASHFTPHQKRNDDRLFLNQGFVTLKQPTHPASLLRVGRFDYMDGTEAVTKDATLEWMRRARVSGRLIANFGFSQVQRTFDGGQAAWDAPKANVTLFAAHPRQGGFELDGWKEMTEVDMLAATLTLKPAALGAGTEARIFGMYYGDRRDPADSVFKVDNRPTAVRNADSATIRIPMLGGHLLHHARLGSGEWDVLAWGVWQGGSWGSLDHRAWAMALEAGYQFKTIGWQPWLRAGYNRTSGDDDPADATHGTFTPALTTVRPFAQFPFFNLMNNTDLFAQLLLRPVPGKLLLRTDVHRLRLTEKNDLWYGGSGAFQRRGSFGFGGRPSNGKQDLATLADVSVDWTVRPWWNLYAYAGHAFGGDVVRAIYSGDSGTLVYLESTLRWPLPK